jgi:hypothetical protein
MLVAQLLTLLAAAAAVGAAGSGPDIQHVVVLVMENRWVERGLRRALAEWRIGCSVWVNNRHFFFEPFTRVTSQCSESHVSTLNQPDPAQIPFVQELAGLGHKSLLGMAREVGVVGSR